MTTSSNNSITPPEEIGAELNRRLMAAPRGKISGEWRKRPIQPMVAFDGFTVSVQAHDGAYCSPRGDSGPWYRFELGFPSASMPEMAEWGESEDENETQTVWAYVPIDDVVALFVRHGGLRMDWDAS